MTGSILLDVAIGVIFALLTFSLIASALQEAIASTLNWRGRMLRIGIRRLLATHALGDAVLKHGLLKGLHGPGTWLARVGTGAPDRFPSNIPAAAFAKSLIETLVDEYGALTSPDGTPEATLKLIRGRINDIAIDDRLKDRLAKYIATATTAAEALEKVPAALTRVEERIKVLSLGKDDKKKMAAVFARFREGADSLTESIPVALQALKDGIGTAGLDDQLKDLLNGVVDHVQEALDAARAELVEAVEALQAEIEVCFDQAMDRVTGWYLRQTKLVLFGIGFAMAMTTNFNLIGYTGDLLEDGNLRAKMVAQAELVAETGKLGEREVGQFPASTSTVWYKADTGAEPDQQITAAERDAILADPSLGPLARKALGKTAGEEITVAEAQTAFNEAWEKLKPFDTDGKPGLSAKELNAAAAAALANLQGEFVESLATLNRELGEQGVSMGWSCGEAPCFFVCIWDNTTWTMFLSWLMVGLGCTLGGQFWYDMLKNLMKVRTAVASAKPGAGKPAAAGAGAGAAAPAKP